ncbi:MAG: T9SS type A sorting domain-containing protein [Bacteroidales bacterium]
MKNDIAVNRFISPVMYRQYGFEPVTVEVTNLGRDTVNSIDLSYILNDQSPVSQQFFTTIIPGDTVELTFSTPVDLAEPGNYFLGAFPSVPDEYGVNDTVNGIFISYNYLIQVGPNPFDSRINFISQGHYDNVTIRIYSMNGILLKEELFEEFLSGQIISMEIPGLAGGMYIIKVKTAFGTSTYKIIKR